MGITRAREDLTLCYAKMRMIRGETQMNAISRFVKEIPVELMDNRVPAPRHNSVDMTSLPVNEPSGQPYKSRPVAVLAPKGRLRKTSLLLQAGESDLCRLRESAKELAL